MAEITAKTTQRSPYILVCFQECERMNLLLAEIRRSLQELDLGLKVLSAVTYTSSFKKNAVALKRISLSTGRTDPLLQYGESAVSPVH